MYVCFLNSPFVFIYIIFVRMYVYVRSNKIWKWKKFLLNDYIVPYIGTNINRKIYKMHTFFNKNAVTLLHGNKDGLMSYSNKYTYIRKYEICFIKYILTGGVLFACFLSFNGEPRKRFFFVCFTKTLFVLSMCE